MIPQPSLLTTVPLPIHESLQTVKGWKDLNQGKENKGGGGGEMPSKSTQEPH